MRTETCQEPVYELRTAKDGFRFPVVDPPGVGMAYVGAISIQICLLAVGSVAIAIKVLWFKVIEHAVTLPYASFHSRRRR